MAYEDCDFSGWVTKNDIKCADGRIIKRDAFKVNDGQKVPMVWNHQHNSVYDVLGHTLLENRPEGVYGYSYFNKTAAGQNAKELVCNGDVTNMSIYADQLRQLGPEVHHGCIREVSLVLASANPGAFIESVLTHGEPMEDGDDEGIFYLNDGLIISHAVEEDEPDEEPEEEEEEEVAAKTVKDVYNTLNDDQKKAVAVIVGAAVEDAKNEMQHSLDGEEEEEGEMRQSIFVKNRNGSDGQLSHALNKEDYDKLFQRGQQIGSLKAAFTELHGENAELVLAHSIDMTGMETSTGKQTYGFNDPRMLFPDYKALNETPEWISRNMDWVQKVMGGVRHTAFSRIKSLYADITEDDARAKGYMKGNRKKEEVFTLLKRKTGPCTVYKKQKMDRDDILDITSFNVVAWIKAEMRVMLNEEIARAILMGDGRPSDHEDKIKEDCIRPIVKDDPLFNTKVEIDISDGLAAGAANLIDEVIRARKNYKGSGNPTFFTTEDVLTELLLLKDAIGHRLYKTEQELATALRVRDIVTVEPMEGYKLDGKDLLGVIVNLTDYVVGTDKGGEISFFDDFDIHYNQQIYLLETRMSGALVKPFSALTLVAKAASSSSGGSSSGGTETQSSYASRYANS